MTKLELLLTYTLAQRRDSWLQMGQAESESDQKVFTRGSFLRVIQSGVPLLGCIIYVTDDFTDEEFSWGGYSVDDLSLGTIRSASIISPYLHIILTQAQFQSVTDPYDPTFIPFADIDINSNVIINDDELNMIFIEAGVPFIKFDELEFSKTQFLDYVILPVIYEYYKWFPIITTESYPLSTNSFSIPLPTDAYMAHRVYVNPGYPISNNIGNPISRYFDEVILSTSSQGSFANPSINWKKKQGFTNTGAYSTFIMERAVRQGVINYGSRTRIKINMVNGSVTGYSNKMGMLEIEWASYSKDWNVIPFNRKSEARELATARVLRTLAMLRSQVKVADMGTIDYTGFNTRATSLEDKVIALWQAAAKVVILRGN